MCLGWRPNHSDLIHRDVFLGDGAQLCKNGHLGVHGKQPHQKIDKHSTLLWNIYIVSIPFLFQGIFNHQPRFHGS